MQLLHHNLDLLKIFALKKLSNFYKKRLVIQNKLNLLLQIILYNTWTLQQFTINISNLMESI
jgi:hypothetical protein